MSSVGVDLGFEPLQYRDPDTNEPTGYSIELTKLMMAELGAEIEYVEIPFSELFAAGEAGRFDISGIQATNLPARGLRVAFAGAPAFLEGNYIMLQPDSTITSAADLNSGDVTIAVLAGSSQAAAAKLSFPDAKLKELQEQPATVEDVSTGRSDAVYIGEFGVSDAVDQGLMLLDEPSAFASHNTYFMPQRRLPAVGVGDAVPDVQGLGPDDAPAVGAVRRRRSCIRSACPPAASSTPGSPPPAPSPSKGDRRVLARRRHGCLP